MNLFERRRSMMGKVATPAPTPTVPILTIANAFSLASDAQAEIASLMTAAGISRKNKIVVSKFGNQLVTDRFIGKSWINNNDDTGSLLRYRNGINSASWGNTSAACVAYAGDKYYVIDPSASGQPYDTITTVQSDITKADVLAALIESVIPSTGTYMVYRLFAPSGASQYDYFWSVHRGTNKVGFASKTNGSENLLTSWTSSTNVKVYAGDQLCFLKLFDT